MAAVACGELVDRPLISINRGNVIVAHGRPLAIMRLIAVGARHAGSAADCFMGRRPRLVRMVLADPAGILATVAVDRLVLFLFSYLNGRMHPPQFRPTHKLSDWPHCIVEINCAVAVRLTIRWDC